MAKAKGQKGSAGGAQGHLFARISYLYKASLLFQSAHDPASLSKLQHAERDPSGSLRAGNIESLSIARAPESLDQPAVPDLPANIIGRPSHLARQYASQLRATSLKSQQKLPRGVKHTLCKRCDTILVPGSTCSKEIENKSRGGTKPWADVLVVKCGVCGTVKRYPQVKKRTMKLVDRRRHADDTAKTEVAAG
ncbi:hypothetical protein D8B26_007131 [Coccidioides posadasii str. Silveira]|uniref:RNAse P Rpr2/Rpp21 subunit domain-containing protein n=2 Tax=Coccidioides posadasii TaxID=199306 RepID=E9D4D5_COCPS|nr:RNAse P Rpr2/Rpp21 subunit domain-containing protein [Coccidioides posadasii str. Silveira]KMM71270.1 hypothetical protein CPAG_07577 [Coccidioides posadasii RMSCC 3488]QVM12507.1 hypothetical protein D8B26_007131 [Coccidioides posadasii str. Silveira]